MYELLDDFVKTARISGYTTSWTTDSDGNLKPTISTQETMPILPLDEATEEAVFQLRSNSRDAYLNAIDTKHVPGILGYLDRYKGTIAGIAGLGGVLYGAKHGYSPLLTAPAAALATYMINKPAFTTNLKHRRMAEDVMKAQDTHAFNTLIRNKDFRNSVRAGAADVDLIGDDAVMADLADKAHELGISPNYNRHYF